MTNELIRINDLLKKTIDLEFYNICSESESQDYLATDLQLNSLILKSRKAKTTPKKIGLFVTLWKRNTEHKTEPFHKNDVLDYCIIITEHQENFAFFFSQNQYYAKRNIFLQ